MQKLIKWAGISILLLASLSFFPSVADAAIAYDTSASVSQGSGTVFTYSYTAAAGNPLLIVGWEGSSSGDNFVSITAGGTAMTQMGSAVFNGRAGRFFYITGKSGTFNIVATITGGGDEYNGLFIVSYTGVSQTAPEAQASSQPNTSGSSVSSASNSVTTVAANSLIVGYTIALGYTFNSVSGGSGTPTIRSTNTAWGVWDSGLIASPGSQTLTSNYSGGASNIINIYAASFAPAPPPTPAAPVSDDDWFWMFLNLW